MMRWVTRTKDRIIRNERLFAKELVSWKFQGLLALFNVIFSIHFMSTLPSKITLRWLEFDNKAVFLCLVSIQSV